MSRKKKYDLKNFAILFLFIVAIYQTGTLWLENYSGHNFFYYITSWDTSSWRSDAPKKPIDAEFITVGYGNKMYSVFYGSEEEEIKTSCDEIIKQALKEDNMTAVDNVSITDLLEQRSIVYTMVYESLLAEYIDSWGISPDEKELGSAAFDTVVVLPWSGINGESRVLFVNSSSSSAVEYKVNTQNGESLYSHIEAIARGNSSMQYISTAQNGFNIFSRNVFVPQWSQSVLQYSPVVKKEIFDIDDEGDMLSRMDVFFGSYYGQTSDVDAGGVYTLSDDYTVVKYYPDGIMEYYSYKSQDNNQSQNLYSAYNACMEFLAKDTNINTDYYISGVQIKNSSIDFYFDYCIDNMPVVSDSPLMSHAIEVSVKDNVVRKYRRYAYDFEIDSDRVLEGNVDFLDAVNESVSKSGNTAAVFENIFLGYAKDEDENFVLKWFTVIDGNVYETDLKQK